MELSCCSNRDSGCSAGIKQQVVVIPEQAVRNTADAKARKRFCQELEERFVVLIIGEDARFLVAAGIHVMQQTGRMQTQWTAHMVAVGQDRCRTDRGCKREWN